MCVCVYIWHTNVYMIRYEQIRYDMKCARLAGRSLSILPKPTDSKREKSNELHCRVFQCPSVTTGITKTDENKQIKELKASARHIERKRKG